MQDVTVNDGWHKITFHSEDGNSEYHKVMWGRLGYGNWDRVDDRLACGDTFEPAICMTVTEHDALNADCARLVARIEALERELAEAKQERYQALLRREFGDRSDK